MFLMDRQYIGHDVLVLQVPEVATKEAQSYDGLSCVLFLYVTGERGGGDVGSLF